MKNLETPVKTGRVGRYACVPYYHLPVIVFPCHYVDARSPGRGSTEYKVYHLCPFTASKKRGECGNAFKVVNHLQSELVDPLTSLGAL